MVRLGGGLTGRVLILAFGSGLARPIIEKKSQEHFRPLRAGLENEPFRQSLENMKKIPRKTKFPQGVFI